MCALNSSAAKNKAAIQLIFQIQKRIPTLQLKAEMERGRERERERETEGERRGKKRMRGVVAQWYHRVDKSATAT